MVQDLLCNAIDMPYTKKHGAWVWIRNTETFVPEAGDIFVESWAIIIHMVILVLY